VASPAKGKTGGGNEMTKRLEQIERLALLVAKRGRPIHKTCPSCKTPQKLQGSPAIYRHEATGRLSCG
jgi:hypothetical protein